MEGITGKRQGFRRVRTKRELIVQVWNRLKRPSIGERELRAIQRAIRERFGESPTDSPAAIARLLADEGAELRHPEVIEFDAVQRQMQIEKDANVMSDLDNFISTEPLGLKQAEVFIKKLERVRTQSERSGDRRTSRRARDTAINSRRIAQALAMDQNLNRAQRAEQAEIAAWLAVWLQTPNLFADWLDLRRGSPDFRKKFATEKSS